MTLIVILIALISSGLIAIVIKVSQKHFANQIDIQGSITGQIEEIFGAQEVIRSLNYEKCTKKEFNRMLINGTNMIGNLNSFQHLMIQ